MAFQHVRGLTVHQHYTGNTASDFLTYAHSVLTPTLLERGQDSNCDVSALVATVDTAFMPNTIQDRAWRGVRDQAILDGEAAQQQAEADACQAHNTPPHAPALLPTDPSYLKPVSAYVRDQAEVDALIKLQQLNLSALSQADKDLITQQVKSEALTNAQLRGAAYRQARFPKEVTSFRPAIRAIVQRLQRVVGQPTAEEVAEFTHLRPRKGEGVDELINRATLLFNRAQGRDVLPGQAVEVLTNALLMLPQLSPPQHQAYIERFMYDWVVERERGYAANSGIAHDDKAQPAYFLRYVEQLQPTIAALLARRTSTAPEHRSPSQPADAGKKQKAGSSAGGTPAATSTNTPGASAAHTRAERELRALLADLGITEPDAPCSRHPNGGHKNWQCYQQREAAMARLHGGSGSTPTNRPTTGPPQGSNRVTTRNASVNAAAPSARDSAAASGRRSAGAATPCPVCSCRHPLDECWPNNPRKARVGWTGPPPNTPGYDVYAQRMREMGLHPGQPIPADIATRAYAHSSHASLSAAALHATNAGYAQPGGYAPSEASYPPTPFWQQAPPAAPQYAAAGVMQQLPPPAAIAVAPPAPQAPAGAVGAAPFQPLMPAQPAALAMGQAPPAAAAGPRPVGVPPPGMGMHVGAVFCTGGSSSGLDTALAPAHCNGAYPRGFRTKDTPGLNPDASPAAVLHRLAELGADSGPGLGGALRTVPDTQIQVTLSLPKHRDFLDKLVCFNSREAVEHNERALARAEARPDPRVPTNEPPGRPSNRAQRVRQEADPQPAHNPAHDPPARSPAAATAGMTGGASPHAPLAPSPPKGLLYAANQRPSEGICIQSPSGIHMPRLLMLDGGSEITMVDAAYCRSIGLPLKATGRAVNDAGDVPIALLGEVDLTVLVAPGTPYQRTATVRALVPTTQVSRVYDVLVGNDVADTFGLVPNAPLGQLQYYPNLAMGDTTFTHSLPLRRARPNGASADAGAVVAATVSLLGSTPVPPTVATATEHPATGGEQPEPASLAHHLPHEATAQWADILACLSQPVTPRLEWFAAPAEPNVPRAAMPRRAMARSTNTSGLLPAAMLSLLLVISHLGSDAALDS